jgi:hypothetical protein
MMHEILELFILERLEINGYTDDEVDKFIVAFNFTDLGNIEHQKSKQIIAGHINISSQERPEYRSGCRIRRCRRRCRGARSLGSQKQGAYNSNPDRHWLAGGLFPEQRNRKRGPEQYQ